LTYIVYYSDLFEERRHLTDLFNSIDKDGNHMISKEELKNAFKDSGFIVTDQAFDELFSKLDTDKSGFIDYTEFLAGAVDLSLASSEKNLQAAFNFFDKDGSGAIDKEEIRKATKMGWISEVQVAKLFDAVDTNGDHQVFFLKICNKNFQKISFPEFKNMMEKIILPE